MKARLYRATGAAGNYLDGYTLYFPYPKWYRVGTFQRYGHYAIGTFLGCSPSHEGTMIRCSWDEVDKRYNYSLAGFGKKVKISSMPEPFQKEVARMQALWDEACKTQNFDRWNKEA